MLSWKVLLCVIIITVLHKAQSSRLPFLRPAQVGWTNNVQEKDTEMRVPAMIIRARVREGVPPPLCAGRCVSPPTGPVCAFDAAGTARTFATLCELEAVSCRESTSRTDSFSSFAWQCAKTHMDKTLIEKMVCLLNTINYSECESSPPRSRYYAITSLGEC